MKRALIVVLCLALAFAFVGCSPQAADQTASTEEANAADEGAAAQDSSAESKGTIVFITDAANEWNQAALDIAEQLCEEKGFEYIGFSGEGDAQKQLDYIQTCISKQVTGLIMLPIDIEGCAPSLRKAMDSGIIVSILFDSDDSLGLNDTIYRRVHDQDEQGYLATKALCEAMGGEGEIAIVEGLPGHFSTVHRGNGFYQAVEEYPGIEVVAAVSGNWDRAVAQAAAEDVITANPEIKGFFACDDGMGIGVLEAIKAAGKEGEVFVAGVNGSKAGVEKVKSGEFVATADCSPSWLIGSSIDAIIAEMNGEEAESLLFAPGICITSENAADYDPAF